MKATFRKLRKLLLAAALFCCVLVIASCGATVDTEFTADSNFNGTRVITLTLSNSDLNEYVPGGKDSIDVTIKKYMPDCLTYTLTEGDDSLVCKFTLAFTGIDDYRAKVEKVLAAEIDEPVTPEIEYESIGSPFKSSLKFNENFSSMDLIGWLRYGLQKDEVVTRESTSDWFENGDTKATIAGTEYNVYNSISVDDSVYNTPDSVLVKTYFLTSGNFDRTIDFCFSNDTLTKLSEQSVNVEEHFNSVVTASTVEKVVQDYQTTYSVKMKDMPANQIAAETATILQSENVSFSGSINPDVNVDRRLLINVSEKLDGAYYLRNDRNLSSIYFLYEGAEPSDSSAVSFGYYSEDDVRGYSYTPSYIDAETAESTFIWDVDFEKAGAYLDISGDKINLDIKMYASADMLEIAKQILNDSLTEALPEGVKLETKDEDGMTAYTVDLGTKNAEEEAAVYREFVYNYTGEKAECKFETEKSSSTSPFKTITSYSAVIDMNPLSSNAMDFTFKKTGDLYILDNSRITTYAELLKQAEDEQAEKMEYMGEEYEMSEEDTAKIETLRKKAEAADYSGEFYGSIRFYAIEESTNVFAIVFLILFIVFLLAAIIAAAVGVKFLMSAKPAAPTAIPAPQQPVTIAQNVAPVQPVAPVAEAPAAPVAETPVAEAPVAEAAAEEAPAAEVVAETTETAADDENKEVNV